VRVHGRSQTKIHPRSRTLRRYRDTPKVPLVVDAQRAPAPDAGPPMIIGAVRCPAHYIATWHRDRRKSQSVVGDFSSQDIVTDRPSVTSSSLVVRRGFEAPRSTGTRCEGKFWHASRLGIAGAVA